MNRWAVQSGTSSITIVDSSGATVQCANRNAIELEAVAAWVDTAVELRSPMSFHADPQDDALLQRPMDVSVDPCSSCSYESGDQVRRCEARPGSDASDRAGIVSGQARALAPPPPAGDRRSTLVARRATVVSPGRDAAATTSVRAHIPASPANASDVVIDI
jgi:hypothetical protein